MFVSCSTTIWHKLNWQLSLIHLLQCFLGQQHGSKWKVKVKYTIDVCARSYVRKRKLHYKKHWLIYPLLNNKALKPNKANEKHDCILILFSHSKFFCSLPPYSLFLFLFLFFVSRLVQSCSCFKEAPLPSWRNYLINGTIWGQLLKMFKYSLLDWRADQLILLTEGQHL